MTIDSSTINTPENQAKAKLGVIFHCPFEGSLMAVTGPQFVGRTDKTPHWRCFCRKCGSIYAIDMKPTPAVAADAASRT